MKIKWLTMMVAVLLILGISAPDLVLAAGPKLAQLSGVWNGSIKLSAFNLGEPPASPAPGEKVLCDPQIYQSVKKSLEEMQAKGPIPLEIDIAPDTETTGTCVLKILDPKMKAEPISILFQYADNRLSGDFTQEGGTIHFSASVQETPDRNFLVGSVSYIDPTNAAIFIRMIFSVVRIFPPTSLPDFGKSTGYKIELQHANILRYQEGKWVPAGGVGTELLVGDKIEGGSGYRVVVISGEFGLGSTRLELEPNTTLMVMRLPSTMDKVVSKVKNTFNVLGQMVDTFFVTNGGVRSSGNPGAKPVLSSRYAITGTLGTDYVLSVLADGSSVVKVIEGKVFVGHTNETIVPLEAGQSVSVSEEELGSLQSFDVAMEQQAWAELSGITPSSIAPSSEVPTGISPTATALPTPPPTASGAFLGLSTQWWIVIGAGLGLLLLAILVLVLILRSGRRGRPASPAFYPPPIPGPATIPCRACGTPLSPGQRFCASCGVDSVPVAGPPVAPPVVPVGYFCPACRRPANPGDRFCQGCGGALPGGPA